MKEAANRGVECVPIIQKRKLNNRRGSGRAGHYGMACRAVPRISIGTMKEAAN
jgi:hypothetical protein